MPPPTPIPGEQLTCPGGASPPPPGLPLMSLWGPGGVTPVPFPSGGPDRLPASSLFLILERSLQWSTGPPGFGYRDCATRRETYVRMTPLPLRPHSVPSYPPRLGTTCCHSAPHSKTWSQFPPMLHHTSRCLTLGAHPLRYSPTNPLEPGGPVRKPRLPATYENWASSVVHLSRT